MSFDLFVHLKSIPADLPEQFAQSTRRLGMPMSLRVSHEDSQEDGKEDQSIDVWYIEYDGDEFDGVVPEKLAITEHVHPALHEFAHEVHFSISSMSIVFTIASALCEICVGLMQDPQLVAADIAAQMPPGLGALKLSEMATSHGIYDAKFAVELAELFEQMGM